MSSPQTDSHWNFQASIYQSFDKLVEDWREGTVDYDEVEYALRDLIDDEDVAELTYRKCEKLWEQAKADDEFWQGEELEKWNQLNKDQEA